MFVLITYSLSFSFSRSISPIPSSPRVASRQSVYVLGSEELNDEWVGADNCDKGSGDLGRMKGESSTIGD